MASILLSRADLRVLRAVDERPGVVAEVLARATGYGQLDVQCALATLEYHELVRASTIARTRATSYRITREGISQLIATPPPRMRLGARVADIQSTLFSGAGR